MKEPDVAPGTGLPPAVAPVPQLTADQLARAQRQLVLPGFGQQAQRRLANARVLLIGAGGLGSASLPYLVGSGVGTIGLVDDDVVELSNLHRQVTHTTASIGSPKTASLAAAARALDPAVTIIEHQLRLTSHNALEVFAGYDLVIDGSDNFPTRYLSNDAAALTGIPLVWGAILGTHGQVGLAWHEHGPGYRDLFPAPPEPGAVPNCEVGGVLPGLCGTIGSLLATEALKVITGLGKALLGRVLVYDALAAGTRQISYGRDPQGTAVRELIDYELFCNGPPADVQALEAAELASLLRAGQQPWLLDVRTPTERAQLRITGAHALGLDELEDAVAAGAPLEQLEHAGPVTIYCARQPRSIRAAQLLAGRGISARYLAGGILAFDALAPEFIERSSEAAAVPSAKEN